MSTTEPVSPAGGSAVPAAGGGAVAVAAAGSGHLRAVFLGPRGGGTLRRRASNAFRLGFAVVVVAVSIPVMRANSAAEIAVVQTADEFVALVGGDVAVFAVRVRFFRRQGYDAATAVSSGAIATTAGWLAQGLLLAVSIFFAAGSFHAPEGSGTRSAAVWVIVAVVVAAGVAAMLLTSAGVPQSQAVAAVFIQRLFTAYLPPVWGWVTLAWMRRREYV